MISLRLFVLILVTLACREIGEPVPTRAFLESLVATAGITLGFGLAFKALTLGSLMNLTGTSTGVVSSHDRLRSGVAYVWIAVLPVTLFTTGVGPWIATLHDVPGMKFIALLCWFAPSVLVLLFLELTTAQFEQIVAEHNTIDKRAVADWPHRLLDRLRCGDLLSLAICLFPVAATTFILDAASLLGTEPTGPMTVSIVSALTLAGFLVALPWLLATRSSAEHLSSAPMTLRAERYVKQVGLRGVAVRITPDMWHGAAIVGFIPGFRQLWLSRSLEQQLSNAELDMVIMHELAHVRRLHFLVRLTPILAAASVLALFLGSQDSFVMLGLVGSTAIAATKILAVLSATICLLAGVSLAARKCEYDADSAACRLARHHCDWAQSMDPAATLSSALVKLIGDDPSAAATTWLHPSLKDRLKNLASSTTSRANEARSLTV